MCVLCARWTLCDQALLQWRLTRLSADMDFNIVLPGQLKRLQHLSSCANEENHVAWGPRWGLRFISREMMPL